ncbi:hypothetical protein LOTGIDRAFT_237645 [Lottia gigantea]|uniref:Protein quiver n=1 Tax=Lottia gigantea TaxID=225164 RepID=V4B7G5_LOTGI|nr:hypothetical protein LOTGIDRAFT_237645 [Lottia gigantea]ESP03531.1 hypothetical protein LOTGIDRAFT_237645 [Lottia gigantea]
MATQHKHEMFIKSKIGLCILILFLGFLPFVESILCYQCADGSKTGGDCKNDLKGLVKSSLGDEDKDIEPIDGVFSKNCSTSSTLNNSLDFCVIETFMSAGDSKSFLRDCSDGRTFSYSGELKGLDKLEQIEADNETTCIYRMTNNIHICITLCTTDFCNGPQPNETVNCTDNATCAAGRPLWMGSSTMIGPFYIHPIMFPILIYIFSVFVLN